VRVRLDAHDRRETQSAFVQRLAEIGAQHASQDALVDGPEKLLVGLLVNVDADSVLRSLVMEPECFLLAPYNSTGKKS
jgi:hypothetical protein